MQNTKQKSGTKQKLTIAAIFGAMGPGLLAALSGNDAGGIATYSSAGASYGYKMLWMLPVMTVLLIVTQETAARCGCVTGKGLASLIRERFGVRKSVLAMAALLIANTAVTISEFAGIASGLALFGVPASISVPLVALLVWMLTMSGSFQRIEQLHAGAVLPLAGAGGGAVRRRQVGRQRQRRDLVVRVQRPGKPPGPRGLQGAIKKPCPKM